MEGHGCAGLEVSELEETSGHVGVVVEEAEELVLELWEFLLIGEAGVVLEVVVEKVNGLRLEKGTQLGIVVDDIPEMHLIDVGIEGSVSDSGPEEHPGQDGESLEAEGKIPKLVEEEGQ